MCNNQPEVGQYDLCALTEEEQRLLKAAPGLLKACQDALEVFNSLAELDDPFDMPAVIVQTLENAIEATNV